MNQVLQPIPNDDFISTAPARFNLRTSLAATVSWCFKTFTSQAKARKLADLLLLSLLLTIPGVLLYTGTALNSAGSNLDESQKISVFLSPSLPATAISELAISTRARSDIASAEIITHPAANTNMNFLELTPVASIGTDRIEVIANQLRTLTGVEFVIADIGNAEQQSAAAINAKKLALLVSALGLLLACATVVIIVRRDLQHHRQHMKLMSQLGATESTIRKPLLLRAAVLGIAAGAIGLVYATVLLGIVSFLLDKTTYQPIIPDRLYLGMPAIFLLVVLAACLLTAQNTKLSK